jgi:hypothetical protein
MCRVMRHHRQPAAGMASILDADPHHDEACLAALDGEPASRWEKRLEPQALLQSGARDGAFQGSQHPHRKGGFAPPHKRISRPRT